jgi:nucleoid-associated protein YgaU
MGNRYDKRRVFFNRAEIYDNIFEDRGVNYMIQFNTPHEAALSMEQIGSLKKIKRIWNIGDRLYKMAAEYYDDPTYWWIIAHFNQKPTEAHFTVGEPMYIPMPLARVLEYYGV